MPKGLLPTAKDRPNGRFHGWVRTFMFSRRLPGLSSNSTRPGRPRKGQFYNVWRKFLLYGHAIWVKNAGATYQRLMDRIFKGQAGRNVEVYVDNILIKSREKSCFIKDLEEIFSTLRKNGVKLNPAKCTFGVKSGKFLGFIVTERGIEVNPAKVQVIMSMTSPVSVKKCKN